MKYTFLRCCMTPILLAQYETSVDAVFGTLGVEVNGDEELSCCGYPLRSFSPRSYVLASARNLALAERKGLNLLTVCSCCYGSLKHAGHMMEEDPALKEDINRVLTKEGLSYTGASEARHLLQILYDDIGVETIREMACERMRGHKVATHYGCHLLRPEESLRFENAFSPQKLDRLVEATGARSVPWPSKLDCCGSPLMGVNDKLSMDLTAKKLANAAKSGADILCVVCASCQIQFDRVQSLMLRQKDNRDHVPSILFSQFLGLALGIDQKTLGLDKNLVSCSAPVV